MSAQFQSIVQNIENKHDHEFNKISDSLSASSFKDSLIQKYTDILNPQIPESKLGLTQANIETSNHKKHSNKNQNTDFQQVKHMKAQTKKPSIKNLEQNQQDSQLGQQKDQNIYKSVSNKLESALKKISYSNHESKNMKKNKTMTIFQRFNGLQKKKQKQLQEKRLIEDEKKYFGLKQKPDIDPNSRRIATQTSYKPIYQRYEHIMAQKQRKLKQNQQSKRAKQQQEYENFLTQYQSHHSKLQKQECRDSQTYFHDMMAWKAKLDKQTEQKQKQKQEKSKQGYTFKPQLNQKSMRLLQNKKRVPIQDRQIQKSSSYQIQYAFKPKVNKRKGLEMKQQ